MTPDAVLPLGVAAPLAAAALLAFGARGRLERFAGPVAMVTAFATAGALAWAATFTSTGALVHWFGGWRPTDGIVPGIPFVGGPISTPLAALVAALVGTTLVYSSRYLDEVTPTYHVLVLTFLAGMVGFVLTGDGFDLFVFYELVGVSAYALTAYVVQQEGPLQGAINFAVSNTIGSLLLLAGIAFLYVATGTPNLAAAGEAIADGTVSDAVVAAYVLVAAGLFVKAAVVPFHFWHADAHAVAPIPICALFAGIMIQLGVYAFTRMNWVVFHGLWAPHDDAMRTLLVIVASGTALVAGGMAVAQSHLKRLLAYSSVAHTGVAMLGVAMLSAKGLTGAGLYIGSHAAVKAALFLAIGIVLRRFGEVDERALHGRGRPLVGTGALVVVGGFALAGLPPFGVSLGKEIVAKAAADHGFGWLATGVVITVGALTGGAVLRASARIFAGWGEPSAGDETDEDDEGEQTDGDAGRGRGDHRTPVLLLAPVVVLLLAALLSGAVPAVVDAVESAARWFAEPDHYVAAVLDAGGPGTEPVSATWFTFRGLLKAGGAVLAALVVATLGVFHPRLPDRWRRSGAATFGRVGDVLRAVHSGHVGDYVAWLLAGVVVFGAVAGTILR